MNENKKKKVTKSEKKTVSFVKEKTNKSNASSVKKEVIKKRSSDKNEIIEKNNKKSNKIEFKSTEIKEEKKKKSNNKDSIYATGKRKNSIAKIYLKKGSGKISINGQDALEYLKRDILCRMINQPFELTNLFNKYDVVCSVIGGGLSGQAGAIRHAISVALQLSDLSLRKELKDAGFLTRDSRVVERKKAGSKKARKGHVYQRR